MATLAGAHALTVQVDLDGDRQADLVLAPRGDHALHAAAFAF